MLKISAKKEEQILRALEVVKSNLIGNTELSDADLEQANKILKKMWQELERELPGMNPAKSARIGKLLRDTATSKSITADLKNLYEDITKEITQGIKEEIKKQAPQVEKDIQKEIDDAFQKGSSSRITKSSRPSDVTAADEKIFRDLPSDLSKLTQEQIQAVLKYYAGLPLRELRKRQQITKEQKSRAAELKNTQALDNLEIMEDLLFDAIYQKEFPDA